jgi:oligopeptidase B
MKIPYTHSEHGVQRADPYHWLRERDNPRVIELLEEETRATEKALAGLAELETQLYRELIGRLEESHESAPLPEGDWVYKSRMEKGQEYAVCLRRPKANPEADWTVYFDSNVEAAGCAFFDLGFLEVSPDGRLLAYAVDTEGDETYTLRFRDLQTGKNLPHELTDVAAEGEWNPQGTAFLFLREDATRRPNRIYLYRLGDPPEEATLLFTEDDSRFHLSLGQSQDHKVFFAMAESNETSEIHTASTSEPLPSFKCFQKRKDGIQYSLDHHQGSWLVRTNEGARDFFAYSIPVDTHTDPVHSIVWNAQEGVRLEDILVLEKYWIFHEREGGLERFRVRHLASGKEQIIAGEDPVYSIEAVCNEDFATDFFHYSTSSPIRPEATFQHNLATGEVTELVREKVPSGHNPEAYSVRLLHVPARDGSQIPLTLVEPASLKGPSPLYAYAYGAYGSSVDLVFRRSWLTWLQRGWRIAIPHVRGGGFLGEDWYQAGKRENKVNTFTDTIDCIEFLLTERIAHPAHCVLEGGSAGGLLVGAVINERPDLFAAAHASVPFVDVVTTMLDAGLPLTTYDYEEWGNPNEPEDFHRMLQWSPYDNVGAHPYPALYVSAGLNDPRVPYWEATKWVLRIREMTTSAQPVLLHTDLDTGHMGPSGRYSYWKTAAREQAFLLHYGTASAGN